jgi:hypothetical protein
MGCGTMFVTVTCMKLRIKGNSLRLRLTRTEVDRFASEGVIEEMIGFGPEPDQILVYRLCRDDSVSSIQAGLANNELTVSVSAEFADHWIETEQVAMEAHNNIGNERFLHTLIEKDFACLAPRPGDDDKDAFPHPAAGRGC